MEDPRLGKQPLARARDALGPMREHWRRLTRGADGALQVLFALLILGSGLRAWHFFSGRSLWLDEAMVSASITGRDWSGLLQPLDYAQVAPVGWLFVEKAIFEALGRSDIALLLPQFVVGIAALLLFGLVSRRMVGPLGAVAAVALFALSPVLVRFSAEVKPYGVDAFVSVVLLLFCVRFFDRRDPLTLADFPILLATGAAAVAVSFPAAFVLASFGGLLFLREAMARRGVTALGVVAISSVWLAVFVALQFGVHQSQDSSLNVMSTEWRASFAPFPPTSASDVKWYFKAISTLFVEMFGDASAIPALIAVCVGAVVVVWRRPLLGAALLAPAAITLLASGLHLYPFRGRLIIFLLPHLILLMAVAVDAAVAAARTPIAAASAMLAVLGFGSVASLWAAYTYYPLPFATEHIEPVLRQIAGRRAEGEPIYVDNSALPAFRHYRERTGLGAAPIIEGRLKQADPRCLLADMVEIGRNRRIWVLYSHSSVMMGLPEETVFTYFADAGGRRIHAIDSVNVHAYLYEFDADGAERLAALRSALPSQGSACDV